MVEQRGTAWLADDPEIVFPYSGKEMRPSPITPLVSAIRHTRVSNAYALLLDTNTNAYALLLDTNTYAYALLLNTNTNAYAYY